MPLAGIALAGLGVAAVTGGGKALFVVDDKGSIEATIRRMEKFHDHVLTGVERDLATFTFQLRDEVRKGAEGPPGPNKVTGAYWNSIVVEGKISRLGRWGKDKMSMRVISTHPAAARLEYGYVGRDAAGRHYNQLPRPHWMPAAERVGQEWVDHSIKNTYPQAWKAAK